MALLPARAALPQAQRQQHQQNMARNPNCEPESPFALSKSIISGVSHCDRKLVDGDPGIATDI